MTYQNLEAKLPPPPNAQNDLQQQGDEQGIMLPMKVLKPVANWYMTVRPFAPLIMKMARIKGKIPPELDDAMSALAASGDPEALRRLAEGRRQSYDLDTGTPGEGPYEVPPDEPGTRVMTDDMAEQAYYLHTTKHMTSLQIAQYFTDRGAPVSKATVTRYIEDKRLDYEEEDEERAHALTRRLQVGFSIVAMWFFSAVGLHYLFNFLHVF